MMHLWKRVYLFLLTFLSLGAIATFQSSISKHEWGVIVTLVAVIGLSQFIVWLDMPADMFDGDDKKAKMKRKRNIAALCAGILWFLLAVNLCFIYHSNDMFTGEWLSLAECVKAFWLQGLVAGILGGCLQYISNALGSGLSYLLGFTPVYTGSDVKVQAETLVMDIRQEFRIAHLAFSKLWLLIGIAGMYGYSIFGGTKKRSPTPLTIITVAAIILLLRIISVYECRSWYKERWMHRDFHNWDEKKFRYKRARVLHKCIFFINVAEIITGTCLFGRQVNVLLGTDTPTVNFYVFAISVGAVCAFLLYGFAEIRYQRKESAFRKQWHINLRYIK